MDHTKRVDHPPVYQNIVNKPTHEKIFTANLVYNLRFVLSS